jgi:hypothetical protein
MKTIIGIDPGIEGAIAVYEPVGLMGDDWEMQAFPIPLDKWRAAPRPGRKHPRIVAEYAEGEVAKLFRQFNPANAFVFLEKQQAMTRFDPKRWNEKAKKFGMNVPPSVQSTFNLACGYAWFRGMLAALQIGYELVPPKTWQLEIMGGRDKTLDTKAQAAIVCRQMYPLLDLRASSRCTNPHEGICDAVLIATYGHRKHYGKLKCKPTPHAPRTVSVT